MALTAEACAAPSGAPLPAVGTVFRNARAFRIAVMQACSAAGVETTVIASDPTNNSLRCRLRSDSTPVNIGNGAWCTFAVTAARNEDGKTQVTEVETEHSCDATVRAERRSIAEAYMGGKLAKLGAKAAAAVAPSDGQGEGVKFSPPDRKKRKRATHWTAKEELRPRIDKLLEHTVPHTNALDTTSGTAYAPATGFIGGSSPTFSNPLSTAHGDSSASSAFAHFVPAPEPALPLAAPWTAPPVAPPTAFATIFPAGPPAPAVPAPHPFHPYLTAFLAPLLQPSTPLSLLRAYAATLCAAGVDSVEALAMLLRVEEGSVSAMVEMMRRGGSEVRGMGEVLWTVRAAAREALRQRGVRPAVAEDWRTTAWRADWDEP